MAAIGITNQRETTVVWDRKTGATHHQRHRLAGPPHRRICDRLRADGVEPMVRERTGLVLDAYFSGTKLAWILDHVRGARARAEAGELAFGTIDTWLVWKLTGGRLHVTDPSNASRTLLFNIHTGAVGRRAAAPASASRAACCPRSAPRARSTARSPPPSASPACPSPASPATSRPRSSARCASSPGLTKNTYGTGCFMLQNTGTHGARLAAQAAHHRRLEARTAGTEYALEGSVFIGGAVVQWLRDGLGIIRSSAEVEALAASVPDNGGVYLVPAFAGLGAPHWDPYARGTIVGLTRGTTAGHIARAALEAIAFQSADLLDAMQADAGVRLAELRVDGGAARNDLLMQFQADLLGVPVVRPQVTETTALGAAYLAGLAVGFWKSTDEIAGQWRVERRFEPKMPADRAASCGRAGRKRSSGPGTGNATRLRTA